METHADLMARIHDLSRILPENAEVRALLFAAYKKDWSEFEGILYGMHDIRDMSYNDTTTEDAKCLYDSIDEWYTVNVWDPAPVYVKRGHK